MNPVDRAAQRFHYSTFLRAAVYGTGVYLVVPGLIARLAALRGASQLSTATRSWKQIVSGTFLLGAGACLDLRARHIGLDLQDPFQLQQRLRNLNSSIQNHSRRGIHIKILRKTLKQSPVEYALMLARQIQQSQKQGQKDPKLHVHFQDEPAADCGGPARDFLNELCGGLTQALPMTMVPISGRYAPANAVIDEIGRQTYEAWGSLLMYCYYSVNDESLSNFDFTYVTGIHLDESVLGTALSLSQEELNTPIERMPPATQLRLYQTIVEGRGDLRALQQPLRLLVDDRTNEQAARNYITEVACEDLDPTKKPIDQLQELMLAEFKRLGIHAQLAPIQAIARGMQRVGVGRGQPWDEARATNAYVFSEKAQGVVNAEEVAQAFKLGDYTGMHHYTLKTALDRIQGWIRNEATPTEIQMMLYQLTGSDGLIGKRQISISYRHDVSDSGWRENWKEAAPVICTCNLSISFNAGFISTLDQQQFIELFKKYAVSPATGFTQI